MYFKFMNKMYIYIVHTGYFFVGLYVHKIVSLNVYVMYMYIVCVI